jgi:quinol monooxygenase YgiN
MSTLVLLECQIKPGFSAQAAQTMIEQLPDTRAFEGCKGIHCYREHDGVRKSVTDFVSDGVEGEEDGAAAADQEGERLVLVEYWDSLPAYHKYVTWRTQTGDLPDFVEICDGPPVLRTFDLMDG